MSNARAFSTKFEDQKGLIHALTKKCWGRMRDFEFSEHSYEDVFQINCETYVKAMHAYDPNYGITFSAYLGRAIYNQFNRFVERAIAEKSILGFVSTSELELDETDFFEFYMVDDYDEGAYFETSAEKRQNAKENLSKLSRLAKLVIRELLSPSPEMQQAFNGMKAHSELAAAQGEKYIRVPREIDFRAIRIHYGFRSRDIAGLKKEFQDTLGVKIG